jgi:hypothetical protein
MVGDFAKSNGATKPVVGKGASTLFRVNRPHNRTAIEVIRGILSVWVEIRWAKTASFDLNVENI